MSDLKNVTAEQITFYSYWLPALAPGEYRVSVKSELKGTKTIATNGEEKTEPFGTDEKDIVTAELHVGAPRWALTGSEIYSCYPAPGQIGDFSNTLPHVVFDRCTLPWERTIDGTDPTVAHDPWLALILLTDADFSSGTDIDKKHVPPIVPGTLAKVLHPEANVVGPKIQLDPYDSESDPCRTIDLPASVFRDVMPRKEDLQYFAHVREVKTDNKETWSLLKEGKFSVVVCNRFPETQPMASGEKDWGIVNTVCLVSLEGWGDYLNNPTTLAAGKTYCLLVLGSWRFTCQGSSAFKSLMTDLDDSRLLSRPPLTGDESEALRRVNTAFQMGFAPINHDLRNEDTTISWFRGPLVPMSYQRSMSYADISCADAALRYDSNTAMFDASFAAAWQLGRLLALQDQAFAQALFRFRTDYQRWVRITNTEALSKMADLQDKLGGKTGDKPINIRDWYAQALVGAGYLSANGAASNQNPPAAPPIPATVQNWLGQAMLLYGVPFQYLVPDEEMLPEESIRFFYLNPNWLNGLLQGACSVGRTSETDELADQLLRARFFDVSERLAKELRSNAHAKANNRRGDGPAPPVMYVDNDKFDEKSPPALHWPLSGYLLRSAAVESWIGLEAKASGVDSTRKPLDPLQILRMDRLAPDILLCIYNGKVTWIEVKQPPEAIHFGAASKNYPEFSASDFLDFPTLVSKLKSPTGKVDSWANSQLSQATKAGLENYTGSSPVSESLKTNLVRDFNAIIKGQYVNAQGVFDSVKLRPETETLRQQYRQGTNPTRLNRMLIEDAYPTELSRSLKVKTGLRIIKGEANTLGDKINVSVEVPMSEQRVVQVGELAANIKRKLIDNNQMGNGDSFTSTEFAVEMIESPAKVTFTSELSLKCPAATTGQVGVAYSSQLDVLRGAPPYTFSIVDGSLPPGLTLNTSTGAITGTPTNSGTYNFTAKLVDSSGNSVTGVVTKDCSLTIREQA